VRSGRLTAEQRLEALALVLDGLQHAHEHGVVHRDVKPSNVQVLPDGGLKILDFGIARLALAESLSHTGLVLGTVPYMSPEQLRGERVDARTDVYAAGVLGYELFTGRRPFDGGTLTEIVLKVINDPLPPMAHPVAERFPLLEGVLARALEKQADRRYATAAEMAAAVRAAGQPSPAPSLAPAPPPASTTYRVPLAPRVAAPPPPAATPAASCDAADVCAAPAGPAGRSTRRRLRVAAVTILGLAVLSSAALMGRSGSGPRSVPSPAANTSVPAVTAFEAHASQTPTPAPPAAVPPLVSAAPPTLAGDTRLARALVADLRQRGIRLGGGDRLHASVSITLRPSPFATASARTADFTAAAVLERAGLRPWRCDVDGHALDFGEGPTRASAVRRAAELLAACLAGRAR
jgi:serine/threonine-protein kinase